MSKNRFRSRSRGNGRSARNALESLPQSRLRRRLGWLLVGLSLALHLFTLYAYAKSPDILAAFTVLPVWFWGGCGLILAITAFWFFRATLSLIVTGVWALTILLTADEARSLTRLGREAPQPGKASASNGRPVIRVLTLNCDKFDYGKPGDPCEDIARWAPDIVLLQEVDPPRVKRACDIIYGGGGDFRCQQDTNAVITRGRIIREVRNLVSRDQQVTVQLPDGTEVEVSNIHLASATVDVRFWRQECWLSHRLNRQSRRAEMAAALGMLASEGGGRPAIIGGDFNSPAGDPIHRMVLHDYADAFSETGTGWPDTFQRRIPVQRIDRIHSSHQLTPLRCEAVTTRFSDHRMVVADFLLNS